MNLIKENYKAVVNRGLITPKTTDLEFYNALKREVVEVRECFLVTDQNVSNEHINEEIADVINVCNNWLIKRGQDPEKWLKIVLEKNKKRAIIKD